MILRRQQARKHVTAGPRHCRQRPSITSGPAISKLVIDSESLESKKKLLTILQVRCTAIWQFGNLAIWPHSIHRAVLQAVVEASAVYEGELRLEVGTQSVKLRGYQPRHQLTGLQRQCHHCHHGISAKPLPRRSFPIRGAPPQLSI